MSKKDTREFKENVENMDSANLSDSKNYENPNKEEYNRLQSDGDKVHISKKRIKTAVAGFLVLAVVGGGGFAIGRATDHHGDFGKLAHMEKKNTTRPHDEFNKDLKDGPQGEYQGNMDKEGPRKNENGNEGDQKGKDGRPPDEYRNRENDKEKGGMKKPKLENRERQGHKEKVNRVNNNGEDKKRNN